MTGRVSVWGDRKVFKTGSGDNRPTPQMSRMPPNGTLHMVHCAVYFYHPKHALKEPSRATAAITKMTVFQRETRLSHPGLRGASAQLPLKNKLLT